MAACQNRLAASWPGMTALRPRSLEEAKLLGCAPRRREMLGRELGVRLVEVELLACGLEAAADHPGDRAGAGHPHSPLRVVILAAAGLADQLEHVAVAVGKIRQQPFAEEGAHFERQ